MKKKSNNKINSGKKTKVGNTHLKNQGISTEFCTECNEELEMFSLQQGVTFEDALERHKKCRKSGKFNGELCSRIFIMSDNIVDITGDDD